MLALIAIPLLTLACVPLVARAVRRRPWTAPWLAVLPAALFLLVLTLPDGAAFRLAWIPSFASSFPFASMACRASSRCS
jgi:hypothetical protein